MRKFLFLLAAALLLPLWPLAVARAASVSFPDVPSSYWAATAIYALAAKGIITGEGDGRYHPLDPVTRDQFAALIVRAEKLPAVSGGPNFQDVTAGATLSPDVEAAAANGLMLGTSLTTFSPHASITRAMAAAIAVRALGLSAVGSDDAGKPTGFRDAAKIPGFALGDVYVAHEIGLLQGLSNGDFDPQGILNRAQAATLIYRLLGLSPDVISQAAAPDVASITAGASQTTIAAGSSTNLWAVPRDKAGYNLPATVTWSASGGTLQQNAFSASSPGKYTLTAKVAGSSATKSLSVTVEQPTSVAIYSLPEVAGVGSSVGFTVTILDQYGARDKTAAPTPVTLVATNGGAAPVTLTGTAKSGEADFTFTPPSAGAWHLQATAGSLPAATASFDVLAQPFGTLSLQVGTATILPGQEATVQASLPVGATEASPVVLTSSDSSVVSVEGSDQGNLGPSGLTFKVRAQSSGSVTLTLSNPLDAYAQASWTVAVPSLGSLMIGPPPVATAGSSVTETVTVQTNWMQAPPADVSLTLTNPEGVDMATLDATASANGTASFGLDEDEAGTWTLTATAPGYTTAKTTWTVQAAAPTQLIATGAPSTVVVQGGTAKLQVMAADQYDNPVPQPLSVTLQASGSAGTLTQTSASLPGPGAAANFTASSPGTEQVKVTDTSSPSLAPVTVTFRVIASPADVVAGKGVWMVKKDWSMANQAKIISDLQSLGVTHVYLEVEGSWGFNGSSALRHFIVRAHDAGIAVLAWVYPYLNNVSLDENLTAQVASYQAPTGDRPDGIAADIEENMAPGAVGEYAQSVRQALGPKGVFVAVTYPPIYHESYPYAALAPYVNAYAPMDYWHYQALTENYAQAYQYVYKTVGLIHQLSGNPNIPVSVIAQAYDMFMGSEQGIFNPTEFEEEAAFQASSDAGAIGISFYRLPTMTPQETQAIEKLPYPDKSN